MGNIIENQGIEIQLILHSLDESIEELRKSLKRRKEITIAENDTQYKEIDTTKLFANGELNEFDEKIAKMMEKNRSQDEEIKNLKIEQESQAMMLCKVTEQKKRAIEDKVMIEEDKRNLTNRLEETSAKLARISNMQLDTLI